MSAAEATSAESTSDALHSPWVLDQEPEQGEEAAPRDDREPEREQQAVPKAGFEAHVVAVLGGIAISQLAWVCALVYVAYRLLF
jgi:hypothetical protein